jgi:cell wall-associated NlpC family hydrolase
MPTSPFTPARLLVSLSLAVVLAAAMFVTTTIGPTTRPASAVVTALRADHALDWAKTRKGSPYRYGADGPRRFDCSGLTRWSYARVGKWLPHSSSRQASRVHRIYHRSNARQGDLVFFYGYGGIYHVGIYAGHGYVWHAPHPGTRVHRSHIWTSHVFYGRVR